MARLDAMEQRLRAMDSAARTVRGPLDTFYGLLSDEQKKKLDASASTPASKRKTADGAQLCTSAGTGLTDVPAGQIEKTITLDDKQRSELGKLKTASAQAGEALKQSCPTAVPASPGDRLDAVQMRVTALLQAIDTVRPAVSSFYGSLSDEQKARFNSISQSKAASAAP